MRKLSALILCLFFLVGCAISYKDMVWRKSGVGEAEFNKDCYECDRDALMLPGPQPSSRPVYYPYPSTPGQAMQQTGQDLQDLGATLRHRETQDQMFKRCMEARGWRLIPRSQADR